MSKNIGVIGSGQVGKVLALGLKKHGYSVMIGSREKEKLAAWTDAEGKGVAVGSFEETARFGGTVLLAVLGRAAEEAVQLAGPATLAGKVVIDATNPISEDPPVNGVIQFFTGPNESLMERLQRAAPKARFVKAFSSVGSVRMVNPSFQGGRPTMFICGNDAAAKTEVSALLDQFGWDAEDMGAVESARAIEPLCQLWCIPGFLRNQWTHAFKMLK